VTVFRKSLITLSAAVLIFCAVLVVSVMVFMNFLYYETNLMGLKNTAKTLMTTIGNERIVEIFTSNAEDPGQAFLPLSVYDAHRLTLIAPSGIVGFPCYRLSCKPY
jgi:hypothetical protein